MQHRTAGGTLLQSGDTAGALEHFRQAVSIFEQLTKEDANDARTRRSSAYGYRDLAEGLAATGNRAEAELNFTIALRIFEELAAKDAKNAILLSQQSITHMKMSRCYAKGSEAWSALTQTGPPSVADGAQRAEACLRAGALRRRARAAFA